MILQLSFAVSIVNMHRECVLARDSAIGGYSPYLDESAEGMRDYIMGESGKVEGLQGRAKAIYNIAHLHNSKLKVGMFGSFQFCIGCPVSLIFCKL